MSLRLDEYVPEGPDGTVGDEEQGILMDEWADKRSLTTVLLADQAVFISHDTVPLIIRCVVSDDFSRKPLSIAAVLRWKRVSVADPLCGARPVLVCRPRVWSES